MSFTTTTTTATATAKSICTYSLFGENDDNCNDSLFMTLMTLERFFLALTCFAKTFFTSRDFLNWLKCLSSFVRMIYSAFQRFGQDKLGLV